MLGLVFIFIELRFSVFYDNVLEVKGFMFDDIIFMFDVFL